MSRIYAVGLCSALLFFAIACSQNSQQTADQRAAEARRKAQHAEQRLAADARKLGSEAKSEARALDRQINQAVNGQPQPGGATGQAEEKLRSGARDLRIEGDKAAVKLDQAAMIAKVKAKLASDVGLSTVTSVDVDTTGHVVTLRGTVSSPEQKREAEQAVSQVDGVSKVINDLRVQP